MKNLIRAGFERISLKNNKENQFIDFRLLVVTKKEKARIPFFVSNIGPLNAAFLHYTLVYIPFILITGYL